MTPAGFIQFVVTPLFTEWHNFNPSNMSRTMLNNMHQNKVLWDGIIAKAEEVPAGHSGLPHQPACTTSSSSEEEDDEEEENQGGHLEDSSFKENININVNVHCADVPEEDLVVEDRFESPCGSEDLILEGCVLRRHSLPPPLIHRDLQQALLGPRRESLPKPRLSSQPNGTKGSSRRHSLPVSTNATHTAALDRLAEKLVTLANREQLENVACRASASDILLQRPKITNLSSDIEATFRLSSLNALLAARAAGNAGTLLAGRLTSRQKSHPNKEVTFDIACPAQTKQRSAPHPTGGVLQARPAGSNTNAGRQVLKPLNLNAGSQGMEGRPRTRSGSAEFSNFSLRSRQFHGVLFERPRSMSLEHETQPLLRSIGEWRTMSGE